jgi:hypothetical protein
MSCNCPWFLGDDPTPDQPSAALARLIGALSCSDRDTVTRFAEFLAAGQARRYDRG